jgi:UDPglucose 6-dehydrogenase
MNIAIIGGCGYVGLITGLGFAELGHRVIAIDRDAERVKFHQGGRSHIYEDGLHEVLERLLADGSIRFTADLATGIADAEIIFVAVGSPAGIDRAADLTQVRAVSAELAELASPGAVIVIKSTVPIGAIELMSETVKERNSGSGAPEIIVNPEFLSEGKGLYDFFNPTRIVIGGGSGSTRARMRSLYEPFTRGGTSRAGREMLQNVPYLEVPIAEAQMIKYASNAYLASRISFVNEIASICEVVGADVTSVTAAMGLDPRIGPSYLRAGIGFGGPCLEKDLDALVGFARDHDYEPDYLNAVRARNDEQMESVLTRVAEMLGGDVSGKRICLLGLAFNPGTNDVRTSLSLRIARSLISAGASIAAHDPVAIEEARQLMPEIDYSDDLYDAASGADLLLLLTSWPEYGNLDPGHLLETMRTPLVFDGQNAMDNVSLVTRGFRYRSVGKPDPE